MKTTRLYCCAVALALAFADSQAEAQNLPATLVEINAGILVEGTFDDASSVQNLVSGVARFTEFDAFCVDPLQQIGYGESVIYQVQNFDTLTNSETIARLVGGYLQSSRTQLDAAAVQWAIWEVVAESTLSPTLSNGNVRITGAASSEVLTLADHYLSNESTYVPAALTYLTNDSRQDVASWNAVPEPSTAGLAVLSCLALLRRKRR